MSASSPAQKKWTPPPLETIEAKREWVQQLRREAALMSAQADFHIRCVLAGYQSNYHETFARLAQGSPLSQDDCTKLIEQFKGLSLSHPHVPVVNMTPRALIRLSRTIKICGFDIESCYMYLTASYFVAAAARLEGHADDGDYARAARSAYEAARLEVGPPPVRPLSRHDRSEFARLIPQVRVMRARARHWSQELDKLEKDHSTSPDCSLSTSLSSLYSTGPDSPP